MVILVCAKWRRLALTRTACTHAGHTAPDEARNLVTPTESWLPFLRGER
jgi:hypothetical protein